MSDMQDSKGTNGKTEDSSINGDKPSLVDHMRNCFRDARDQIESAKNIEDALRGDIQQASDKLINVAETHLAISNLITDIQPDEVSDKYSDLLKSIDAALDSGDSEEVRRALRRLEGDG